MQIEFKTIRHDKQRYPTVGDYFKVGKYIWKFFVSKMNNEDYEFLVFLHELVEWKLTQKRGISEESITAFDTEFEKNRPDGNLEEPGHDPKAPYHREHVFAEKIERAMAEELGVDWDTYDKVVNDL